LGQAKDVSGYIDLHCHWVAGVDDGARTIDDSIMMLRALRDVGFARVVATPHMRTGMFDNERIGLEEAYQRTAAEVARYPEMPALGLASEHHVDDVVFQQLLDGNGLPYPGGHAALVEFPDDRFPLRCAERLHELRLRRIRPVLAHPERYRPVWKDITALDELLDGGTLLLLDAAAVVGKYGRAAKKCAHELLEAGYYYAACSDAHRAGDAAEVARGIDRLRDVIGPEETDFLMVEGPRRILAGTVED
jgi:protein-tyrosine phosphatase